MSAFATKKSHSSNVFRSLVPPNNSRLITMTLLRLQPVAPPKSNPLPYVHERSHYSSPQNAHLVHLALEPFLRFGTE